MAAQFFIWGGRDLQVNIDAVEQRASDFAVVLMDTRRSRMNGPAATKQIQRFHFSVVVVIHAPSAA
jgi:CheY-like chemotaxis protein